MIRTGHLAYITLLLLLGWLLIANAACREGRPIQAGAEGLGVAPEEIVLVRIGDQEITLADYLAKDVLGRYAGRRHGIRMDMSTKLLFGQMMLRALMPRINSTATMRRNQRSKALIRL